MVTLKWIHDKDEPLLLAIKEAPVSGMVQLRFTVTSDADDGFYRLVASNGAQSVSTGFFVKGMSASSMSAAS